MTVEQQRTTIVARLWHWPRVIVALALVMMLALGGWTGARAGGPAAITFQVEIGSCMVRGEADLATIDAFRLVVRDADGHLKGRVDIDVLPGDGGSWGPVCIAGGPIKTGDQLVARHNGQLVRLLVVPRLTINVDRVTDLISGEGPASDEVQVAVQPCFPGVNVCLAGQGIPVQTAPDGAYAYDATIDADIDGWGGAVVRWVSSFSDGVFRFRKAPYLMVEAGKAGVSGLGIPGDPVHVRLRRNGDPKGAGVASPTTANGTWQMTLRSHGQPVRVKVGDRVSSDLASDSNLLVRRISIQADLAADTASGRCYPDGPYGVRFLRPNGTELVEAAGWGFGDALGDFSQDALSFLQSGWSMRLFCANAAGDTVRRTVLVP
jgi:hypothetical protein